jgi:hypothetical protein
MATEKFGQPPPNVQALVLASHVHQDTTIGRYYILGTYNQIRCAQFPTPRVPLCLYIAVCNAHGYTALRVRVVEVDELLEEIPGPICDTTNPVDLRDPLRVYEFGLNLSVIFPKPGDYRVQVCAGNEILREARLRVIHAPPPERADGE